MNAEDAVPLLEAPRGRYRVRSARPQDEAALRRMLECTTPADIQLRFFRHIRVFSHELLDAMLRADDQRHIAFVAVPDHAPGTIAATAMLVAEPDGKAAEFGIIVDRAHAGQRLGTNLMKRLLKEARAHGIARVYGTILFLNAEMVDLVRRLGFKVGPDPDDPGCVHAEIVLDAPPAARATAA